MLKIMKRFLCVILAFILICSLSISSFADNGGVTTSIQDIINYEQQQVTNSNFKWFQFTRHDGQVVSIQVKKSDGGSFTEALLNVMKSPYILPSGAKVFLGAGDAATPMPNIGVPTITRWVIEALGGRTGMSLGAYVKFIYDQDKLYDSKHPYQWGETVTSTADYINYYVVIHNMPVESIDSPSFWENTIHKLLFTGGDITCLGVDSTLTSIIKSTPALTKDPAAAEQFKPYANPYIEVHGNSMDIPIFIAFPAVKDAAGNIVTVDQINAAFNELMSTTSFRWPALLETVSFQNLLGHIRPDWTGMSATSSCIAGQYHTWGSYVVSSIFKTEATAGQFTVAATPKKKKVKSPWTSTASSTFKVYLTPSASDLNNTVGSIDITCESTCGGGEVIEDELTSISYSGHTKSFVVDKAARKIKVSVSKDQLAEMVGRGTGTSGKTFISYRYRITGNGVSGNGWVNAPEQKQYELFKVYSEDQVNGTIINWVPTTNSEDKDCVPSGGSAKTFASWIPGPKIEDDPSEEEFIHKEWGKHTGQPTADGTIVANEYTKEDFEATMAIPSTENVSAVLGAETSMIDLAGYVTATREGFTGAKGGEEDEEGEASPEASVIRKIVLNTRVENTWGWYNALDTLSPTAHSSGRYGNIGTNVPFSESHSFGVGGCNAAEYDGGYNWPEHRCILHNYYAGSDKESPHYESSTCDPSHVDDEGHPAPMHDHPSHGKARSHDCHSEVIVYDGISGLNVNTKSGEKDTLLSVTATVSGRGNITWSSSSCTAKGKSSSQLMKIDLGPNFTGTITGTITFTPVANQYWHVGGALSMRGNGTETWYWAPSNNSTPISQGYTHGTGTSVSAPENMVHPGTHEYSLTYEEAVDVYAYRRITDSAVYSLLGGELANIHQITYDGENTVAAPLTASADGQGVNAGELYSVLWRNLRNSVGQYTSGSGRILWEAWKDTAAPFGTSGSVNPEYYLGDAEMNLIIQQDHMFAGACLSTDYDSWEPAPAENDTNNRGKVDNRICGGWVTSTCADYQSIATGDCLQQSGWNEDDAHSKGNLLVDSADYNSLITSEIRAVCNKWQGQNKDDEYHANILSDCICYGNKVNTTVFCGDMYGVDMGIPLFNFHCTYEASAGRSQEKTVYRNHKSETFGSDGMSLINSMLGDQMSWATVDDGGHMPYTGYSAGGVSTTDGGDVPYAESLVGMIQLGQLTDCKRDEFQVSCSKGDEVLPNAIFTSTIEPYANYDEGYSGSVIITGEEDPDTGSTTFAGYWRDHTYTANHSSTLRIKENDEDKSIFASTNSGRDNMSAYGCNMVVSNLALYSMTPNAQWPTCDAKFGYDLVSETVASGVRGSDSLTQALFGEDNNHDHISSIGLYTILPEIFIHNPVTTQNARTIGLEYGNWSGNESKTPDQSMYDQRVSSETTPKSKLRPYWQPTMNSQVWVTPIGDICNVAELGLTSNSAGCDDDTGEVYRNAGIVGYSKDMNCEIWTANYAIMFPEHMADRGASTYIDRTKAYTDTALQSSLGSYQQAPSNLQNFKTSPYDAKFKYGKDLKSTLTTDLVEKKDAVVNVYACTINRTLQQDSDNAITSLSVPDLDYNQKTHNFCYTPITVDLVGLIGNLAIHDTTDFRFSGFFKELTDEWLIEGVIKKADVTKPRRIVSSQKDILDRLIEREYSNADGKPTHATLQRDVYFDGSGGLGGPSEYLPLVPAYNNNVEYRSNCLRLGYKALMSIDTLGNYQCYDTELYDYPVAKSEEDGLHDTRPNYMDIYSHYYLYDFDDGNFYQIDVWSGPDGQKTKVYDGELDSTEIHLNTEAVYVDMSEEKDRRNVSLNETLATEYDATDNSPTALNVEEDYIGYTGHLRLDNRNITYIGSWTTSDTTYNAQPIEDTNVPATTTSQRWHFTQGLTSTAIATYHCSSSDQSVITDAAEKLKADHPHSTIVEFDDFIANGTEWAIRLDGSLVNYPTIKFFSDVPEDKPEWWEDTMHNETAYQGVNVFEKDGVTVAYTIDKKLTPVVCYETNKYSTDDRAIQGTH